MSVDRVDKLTKEQEARFPEFVDKWIKIGLKTGETDWETFDKYMPICYQKAGIKYPKNVVRVSSPLVGALAASIAEGIFKDYIRPKKDLLVNGAVAHVVDVAVSDAVDVAVGDAVDVAVSDAVDGAVRVAVGVAVDVAVSDAVRDAVRDAVSDAVSDVVRGAVDVAVGDAVDVAVGDAVDGAVSDAVRVAVGEAVKSIKNIKISWHDWLGGQFWVGYGWYYSIVSVDYLFTVCNLKLSDDIMQRALAYRKVCESVNYIWLNTDFIIVCARPSEIHRNSNGRLHKDGSMAIKYPDGWGLYYLNGVKVPKYLVETPESELSLDFFNKETNADVRAEFIRKFGVERMKGLGRVVDSYKKYKSDLWTLSEYELIDMSPILKMTTYAPYLGMINQTTGTYHLEGVDPSCKTVGEAINFRWGKRKHQDYETINIK